VTAPRRTLLLGALGVIRPSCTGSKVGAWEYLRILPKRVVEFGTQAEL